MIYEVEEGRMQNCNTVRRLVRKEDGHDHSDRRLVIPMLEIFEVIYESHSVKLDNLGKERTYSDVAKKYYSFSQAMVWIFIKKCLQCNEKQPVIPAIKGAKKPIISNEYRDRFQVDLIDMRKKKKKKNIYGMIQCWIMTVKDHSTGWPTSHLCQGRKQNMLIMSLILSLV